MARSVLQSFVSGTRQMLGAQLFVSVGAVVLAGWTLGVTNDLIRERDRLQERVIQLEAEMGDHGIVVPSTQAVVEPEPSAATATDAYPPGVDLPPAGAAPADQATPEDPKAGQDGVPAPADGQVAPAPSEQAQTQTPPAATQQPAFDPGQIIASLFTPPPPIHTVVLHVRSEADSPYAQRIGRDLSAHGTIRIAIDVMPPRDPRESGYAYFDGRQSRASANLVAQFNDLARRQEIAPWSAQLRGVALPANGEYTVDRLDIVLPPLPRRGEVIR
jgi:hypothetical protein